jgi:hypothetical protein
MTKSEKEAVRDGREKFVELTFKVVVSVLSMNVYLSRSQVQMQLRTKGKSLDFLFSDHLTNNNSLQSSR